MPKYTKSKRKVKPNKTVRRRQSTSGKIRVPVDVRSPSDLPKFIKALGNKKVAIIMIYATWCGHCHAMMPTFNSAANNPKNALSAISIESNMLDSVNTYIKKRNPSAKPISVSGYPSAFLVTNDGTIIKEVEPLNKESINSVMQNSGPLLKEVNFNTIPMNKSVKQLMNHSTNNPDVEEYIPSGLATRTLNNNSMRPYSIPRTPYPISKSIKNPVITSFEAPTPSLEPDIIIPPLSKHSTTENEEHKINQKTNGGSLMSAMARASYTIAPSAALITIADIVQKKYSTRKKRKKRG